jgi:hypothetical protein
MKEGGSLDESESEERAIQFEVQDLFLIYDRISQIAG